MTRRLVRVAPSFFDRLDELLGDERGDDGTPSTTDFLLHEIPPIVDTLAESYEAATHEVEGAPGVRVAIVAGVLVPYIAAYATLARTAPLTSSTSSSVGRGSPAGRGEEPRDIPRR